VPIAEAVVDLTAISANVAALRSMTAAQVMAVVKADGYGHGLLPSARAALAGGADWLGVALLDEALTLRADGIQAPVLAWLWTTSQSEALARAVADQVDIGVSSTSALEAVRAAVHTTGTQARVHLKIDTGLSRNGATAADWPGLVVAAARSSAAGELHVAGIWSHLANADVPGHPSNDQQITNFGDALALAERSGVRPDLAHLGNSAATVNIPGAHFDLVRAGIAVYGLSPIPELGEFGLRPAMTLRAELALVKDVEADQGVSYGHLYRTSEATRLALVPLGYADGIARAASNVAPVLINGERFTVSGRVCMDQFVVDVGSLEVQPGDRAVLFGPGDSGEPTAQDWAVALGTINYEIVTRIGPRVQRTYVNGPAVDGPRQ
jgi:alanine racemase